MEFFDPRVPHTPEETAALGELHAKVLRTLVAATGPQYRGGALPEPQVAYDLVGALAEAAGRWRELARHLNEALIGWKASGRLRVDADGQAGIPLTEAADGLAAIGWIGEDLAQALRRVHAGLSHLSLEPVAPEPTAAVEAHTCEVCGTAPTTVQMHNAVVGELTWVCRTCHSGGES